MRKRSWGRFASEGIEGLVVSLLVLLSWPLAGRRLLDWGARPGESDRRWPGDRLVDRPETTSTRAVSIRATPSDVWPWLVQFGYGRAGFYSYELLERLVGIPVTNVESILPEHQSLHPGDEILLHPKAPGIPVALVEPDRHVCYGTADSEARAQGPDPARSWSMYLVPHDTGCRLILRSCIEPLREPTLARRLAQAFDKPIDFIMEQRMLRTVRRLVEQHEGPEPRLGPRPELH